MLNIYVANEKVKMFTHFKPVIFKHERQRRLFTVISKSATFYRSKKH